jgi:hypothetical protein
MRSYSLAATLLKVVLRLVPTVVIMVTAATAISAAINPYSTAVTPVSSSISFANSARIGSSLVPAAQVCSAKFNVMLTTGCTDADSLEFSFLSGLPRRHVKYRGEHALVLL